jgi:hypothetical protein
MRFFHLCQLLPPRETKGEGGKAAFRFVQYDCGWLRKIVACYTPNIMSCSFLMGGSGRRLLLFSNMDSFYVLWECDTTGAVGGKQWTEVNEDAKVRIGRD